MALSNETLHILRRLLPRRAVDVLATELAAAGGLGADDRAVLDLLATVSPGELRLLKPGDSGAGLYLNDTGAIYAWSDGDPNIWAFTLAGGLHPEIGEPVFQIHGNGSHSWGDGTGELDVKLERDEANELKLSSPVAPGVATYLAFATDDGWVGVESVAPGLTLSSYMGPGYFSAFTSQEFADADNDPVYSSRFGAAGEVDFLIRRKGDICWGDHSGVSDAILKRESAGSLELVPFSGASDLVLHSPDGTRYRVAVANGGTLSVVAA
jgi:hypothetical protein